MDVNDDIPQPRCPYQTVTQMYPKVTQQRSCCYKGTVRVWHNLDLILGSSVLRVRNAEDRSYIKVQILGDRINSHRGKSLTLLH